MVTAKRLIFFFEIPCCCDSLSEPGELHAVRVDTELLRYAVIGRDENRQIADTSPCFDAVESKPVMCHACLPKRPTHWFFQLWTSASVELWMSYGGNELSDAGSV